MTSSSLNDDSTLSEGDFSTESHASFSDASELDEASTESFNSGEEGEDQDSFSAFIRRTLVDPSDDESDDSSEDPDFLPPLQPGMIPWEPSRIVREIVMAKDAISVNKSKFR